MFSACTQEGWQAIVDDASSKGWTSPPENSMAMDLLESAGYADTFYLSDNHKTGKAAGFDIEAEVSQDTVKPGATCWVIKPLREFFGSSCVFDVLRHRLCESAEMRPFIFTCWDMKPSHQYRESSMCPPHTETLIRLLRERRCALWLITC